MTTTTVSPDLSPARPGVSTRAMLWVLLGGVFMALTDASIVNVAGPSMVTDLRATGSTLQLIISGYTLTYAVLLITGARLGTEYGHGRLFTIGVVGFTVASLLCGIAPTSSLLIAARLIQGAAAAMMIPQVLSLIQIHMEGTARARALSLYATAIALGFVAGQVVGGILVSADVFGLGWRSVFLVNLPFGILITRYAMSVLPAAEHTERRRLDFGGVALLSVAMLALVYPLIVGREDGWPTWAIVSLIASPFLFGVFALFEAREARTSRQPLFDLTMFRNRYFTIAVCAQFLYLASYAGYFLSIALYLQDGLGKSPLVSGLSLVPSAIAFVITTTVWPRIPAARQRVLLPLGLLLVAVGFALIGFTGNHENALNFWFIASTVPAGFGMAVGVSPLIGRVLSQVQPHQIPSASGMTSTNVQTGIVVGTATFGSFYLSHADKPGHALLCTFIALAAAAGASALLTTRLR